jgi:hypothetical protein
MATSMGSVLGFSYFDFCSPHESMVLLEERRVKALRPRDGFVAACVASFSIPPLVSRGICCAVRVLFVDSQVLCSYLLMIRTMRPAFISQDADNTLMKEKTFVLALARYHVCPVIFYPS